MGLSGLIGLMGFGLDVFLKHFGLILNQPGLKP